MTLRFYLHNQPNSSGECKIMCEYSHAKGTGEGPVKFTVIVNNASIGVNPEDWIKNRREFEYGVKTRKYSRKEDQPQRLWRKAKWADKINGMLSAYENELLEVAINLQANGKTPTPSLVKEVFLNPRKQKLFWDVYDDFIALKSRDVKPISLQSFNSGLRASLGKYEKRYGRMTFGMMDRNFAKRFKAVLLDYNMQGSTIKKDLERLKNFLRYAHHEGYLLTDYFKDWKVSGSKSIKSALSIADIRELYNHRDAIIDRLLWHFWTGQRYVESINVIGLEGNILSFWKGKEKKGNKIVHQIYLAPPALEIWNKYSGVPALLSKDGSIRKLPSINTSFKNRFKKIDRFSRQENTSKGLKPVYETISTHQGRISLITCMSSAGIDERAISVIAGHSSGKTMTAHYDKVSKERGFKASQEFWEIVKGEFKGVIPQ